MIKGNEPASQSEIIDIYDERAEWEEVLRDGDLPIIEHPAFPRYCRLFYDFFRKSPYHVKRSYETGFVAKRKPYKNKVGFYHPACFPALVARHLDPMKERPFWLALRFGEKSSLACTDFDNKAHVLGHYEDRGVLRPVVRLPLAHFRRVKRLHDTCPSHVWCVSSATLGLHVWEKLRYPQTAEEVERKNRPRLAQIGLGDIELYPSPQLWEQVLRRPFGLDYHTITDAGLLTHWTDQLDHFEAATRAPSFPSVVHQMLELARRGWQRVRRGATFRRRQESLFASQRFLNDTLLEEEVEQVLAWLDSGCPDEEPRSGVGITPPEQPEAPAVADEPPARLPPRRSSGVASVEWSWRQVTDLARHGVPEEDRLYKFLLLLARPLVWRDYYHLPEGERVRRAEDDLLFWVLNKHNGLVTRVQQGQIDNIRHEVRRQVRVAMNKTDDNLRRFYAGIRERDKEYPQWVERLPDLIRSKTTPTSLLGCCERRYVKDDHSPAPRGGIGESLPATEEETTSPLLGCCRRYIKEPDESPLPAEVLRRLDRIAEGKRMRRKGGEYPFVRFARRLLNALWAGDGAAQIHGDILRAWCGTRNKAQVVGYKMHMAESGLISDQWEAHVRPGVSSAVYEMTDEVFGQFQRHYGTAKTKKKVEARFVVTALAEARLETVVFRW